MSERITFKTEDGIEIAANWNKSAGDGFCLLLLHMMPAAKESWAYFQEKSGQRGFSSLAVDSRGHGESINGPQGKIDYRSFNDHEHQKKILDIEAAINWLKNKSFKAENIFLVGASIGANLAVQYLAEHADVRAVAALSPGLDYRGIITMPLVKALSRSQFLFLAASDDDQESFHTVQKLNEISLAKTNLKLFKKIGHGTNMFDRQPSLIDEILDWAEDVKNKIK